MTEIDWNRLQPLRIAVGPHQRDGGFGCAMNVVSYVNGDIQITDYPSCSSSLLARMVQQINDVLGDLRGTQAEALDGWGDPIRLLTPEDAVTAIRLGCSTIGTGGTEGEIVHKWVNFVLWDAEWGYADLAHGWSVGTMCSLVSRWVRDKGVDEAVRGVEWAIATFREMAGLDDAPAVGVEALDGVLIGSDA